MTIGLIMSSAYVSPGLVAEFGRLPPCMLPLGGQRLVAHQIAEIGKVADRLFVALPDDYALSVIDRAEIERAGATILTSPAHLSIGEAISNAVNTIGEYGAPLTLLYGDTLIAGLTDLPSDRCSVHSANDLHSWARAEAFFPGCTVPMDAVLSGLFRFSDVPLLLRALASTGGSFLDALHVYAKHLPLSPFAGGTWHDFGHVQTYYRSTGIVSTAREFNDVTISGRVVVKRSRDRAKIDAEARWFEECPLALRGFLPPFLGRVEDAQSSGYLTSHTYLSTLASLAVFGQLSTEVWQRIFASCSEFLDAASACPAPSDLGVNLNDYYGPKTMLRLEAFAEQGLVAIDRPLQVDGRAAPSALEMCTISSQVIAESPTPPLGLIHGDFCFSNIFFDFRSDAIRIIDPRGLLPDGRPSIFGDPRYEVAKLMHSALSNYDLIVAGRLPCEQNGQSLAIDCSACQTQGWQAMQDAFRRSGMVDRIADPLLRTALQVQLFLSMLPLHNDRPARQRAFLATAANAYLALEAQ